MRATVWRTTFVLLALFWSAVIGGTYKWLDGGGDGWMHAKPPAVKCSPALLKLT